MCCIKTPSPIVAPQHRPLPGLWWAESRFLKFGPWSPPAAEAQRALFGHQRSPGQWLLLHASPPPWGQGHTVQQISLAYVVLVDVSTQCNPQHPQNPVLENGRASHSSLAIPESCICATAATKLFSSRSHQEPEALRPSVSNCPATWPQMVTGAGLANPKYDCNYVNEHLHRAWAFNHYSMCHQDIQMCKIHKPRITRMSKIVNWCCARL